MPRTTKRDAKEYEIESVSKALRVLEAVETDTGEPIRSKRIIERTGFSRDFVMRALKTLELNGYARDTGDGRWIFGKRLLGLAGGDHL
jgi:DNA-binding IclR family transcriptional regulator